MRGKHAFAAVAAAAVLALPVAAFAQTVTLSSLEAQLQALMVQLQAARSAASSTAVVAASTTAATTPPAVQAPILCPQLVRTLSIGDTGTDVANLQGFLAQNPLIYPEGTVTAYFGMLTQDAVERWQSAYGIISGGTPATTGYGVVGPKTRAAITASCAGASGGSSSASSNISTSAASGGKCGIAPQPATQCPGTWSALTNSQGCTIAWQCSVPFPGTATTTGTNNSSAGASSGCPAYTLPLCQTGRLQWLGVSNGCNLGYQCIQ